MATKAQKFRTEEARKGPRTKRSGVKARGPAQPGATKNEHLGGKGDQKATVVIEESASGRPSRKSSRTSSNKQKSASTLDHVRQMKSATAESRHGRRSG